MASRSATVARIAPGRVSWARMPKWIASGAYQTRTSVRSSAGRPSTGSYWEKPVRTAAPDQTGSSRRPSTLTTASSTRGISTVGATGAAACQAIRERAYSNTSLPRVSTAAPGVAQRGGGRGPAPAPPVGRATN